MVPRKLNLRRLGDPDLDESKPKKGPPPAQAVTPLEETIIAESGGTLQVLDIPEVFPPEMEAIEIQAQKLAQVEHLMLQGIRTPHLIAQATSITEPLAEKYVKAVLARWQALGGEVDMKAQRGEALVYMDLLTNTLWSQFQAAKKLVDEQMKLPLERPDGDDRPKRDMRIVGANQARMLNLNTQIIALNTQRHQLYGLTPQAVNQMLVIGGDGDAEVLTRLRKQQGVKELLGKLGGILLKNRQATTPQKPTIDV